LRPLKLEEGWSLLADPEAIRVLSSPLLSDDEIGNWPD
jgi:hypothetical protein